MIKMITDCILQMPATVITQWGTSSNAAAKVVLFFFSTKFLGMDYTDYAFFL